MPRIKTVKVKQGDSFKIINESDLQKGDVIYSDKPKPKPKQKAK